MCKCVLTADSVHDSFARFLESVYKSVGFDQLNICTIQTILENRMTFNEMADLTIKLVCQIFTKRPEFADMMKNLPSSCQLILQSSNPFDVNIVFRCFVEFVAQKTGVTCHFYVSLASYIFEKKEDPLIEWISS